MCIWPSVTVSNIYNSIVSGIGAAVDYIRGLASQAFKWGADIINGIVDGIKSVIGKVKNAVTSVADTIRSYLHFSVPDKGPLTDFEKWMPDFMKGLAEGIRSNKGLLEEAMKQVSASMIINPELNSMNALAANGNMSVPLNSSPAFLSPILDAISRIKSEETGDMIIPVFIGQERIDEIVISAQQRATYRSGGR